MADLTFDAVIIGGGNKGLMLAMYLMKYAGMSVGIFERRHEIGGCLATEETSAPGFRGNTHANIILPMYYMSLWRDFPEFWEYGGRWDQHLCSDGFVFQKNKTALGIYSQKYDPDQTKTAAQIARFSKKDAEKWVKSAAMEDSREYWRAQADMLYNPAEYKIDPNIAPGIATRQIDFFPKMMEAGYVPDGLILTTSSKHVIKEWFESPELQSCILRFAVSSVNDINDALYGPTAMGFATYLPLIGFCPGGTHQIAHACHQILTQMGCKFYTHAEVDKVIIENGAAKGVKLMDGSQIKANKFVVSAGMAPHQVCFDLIGREYIDPILAKRVEMIEKSFGCLMWYTFAVHQAPKYDAEEFFPDIHETEWLGMQPDPDPEHIARECQYMKLGMWPPFEDYATTVGCHSLADPSYAPAGKHVVQNEQLAPPATKHTEKEWLEIKERYADELIQIWQQYAPNMTWDNVIGVDTNSPFDHLRMKNLGPMGTMAGIDRNPWQLEGNRPTPELANHRTPIKNLYATGGCWWVGSNAGASESYNCYKIIAKDLNLDKAQKPWEEMPEPDSLVDQVFAAKKRLRDWGAAHPKKYG